MMHVKIGLFDTFTLIFTQLMIHIKIGLFNTFTLIFIQLMMHVKIRFFNTFILIFYLTYDACKNWSVRYIYTHF